MICFQISICELLKKLISKEKQSGVFLILCFLCVGEDGP